MGVKVLGRQLLGVGPLMLVSRACTLKCVLVIHIPRDCMSSVLGVGRSVLDDPRDRSVLKRNGSTISVIGAPIRKLYSM